MTRFPYALGVAAVLGLTACQMTAPVETCTDRSGATYVKPAGGCPAFVAPPVAKVTKRVPAPVKPAPVPVVERTGGDGGSDGGSGW